ncbi:unnamed protein product, partial [Lymnaea stagnalis]
TLAVLVTITATFVVLSNVTIVVAMMVSRGARTTHNDHNITKLLILSMACVDFLVGTAHMPIYTVLLVHNGNWILGAQFCNIFHGMSNVLCGANACHILCIAVDKYLAVCKPLVYRILDKRIGQVMVVLSWSLPSAMFLLPLATAWFATNIEEMPSGGKNIMFCSPVLNKNILILFHILGFYFPILTSYLFCEIKTMQQTRNVSSKMAGEIALSGRISRNIKAIRTLGTIIVCFSVCRAPTWISSALFVYMGYEIPFRYFFYAGLFVYVDSGINPVMSGFFKPIRKA